jgi:hypothetical protein
MEMRVGAVAKLQGAIGGWETCKIILGLVRTPTTPVGPLVSIWGVERRAEFSGLGPRCSN